MTQETQDYEEINLLDYIKIIIKRWRIIAVIPLLTMLLALGYAVFLTPKIYEAENLIKIGQVQGQLVEPTEQTMAPILTETTAKQIIEQTRTKKLQEFPITKGQIQAFLKTVKINNGETKEKEAPPENFLRISYKDGNPKIAQQVVEILQNSIIASHQKQYDLKIKTRNDILAQKEKELKKAQVNLETSEKLVKNLETALNRYPTSYSQGSGTSLAGEVVARDSMRAQVTNLESEILNSRLSQRYDTMSEIVAPPLLPDAPTKYQKLSVVTLMIAVVLGVFVGVLTAFAQEWWKNNKNKIFN